VLRLKTYTGAADFLHAAGACLAEQEVVNALMLGLAIRLVDEPLAYGSPPYFAAVADEQGPVLAALMTPPHNLILYSARESVPEALSLVARDLIEGNWPVSGTIGPVRLVQAFAGLWTRLTGTASRTGMNQRIYELRQVIHPRYSPGSLRPGVEDEAGLVVQWMDAFHREATPNGPRGSADLVYQRIAERSVFLWDDHGPVSVAVKTRPTQHGITIGMVYTPPEHRRRGYASSCVAALSQQLLDAGFEYCTLFTDLSNPTSNDIYQKIGYRPVCDFQEIKLAARGATPNGYGRAGPSPSG
jgi:predicted GNAT family acetyltransferase